MSARQLFIWPWILVSRLLMLTRLPAGLIGIVSRAKVQKRLEAYGTGINWNGHGRCHRERMNWEFRASLGVFKDSAGWAKLSLLTFSAAPSTTIPVYSSSIGLEAFLNLSSGYDAEETCGQPGQHQKPRDMIPGPYKKLSGTHRHRRTLV